MSATWYPEHNAWIADMSQTNGTFLVMGSFGPMDHHVAGAPVTGGPDIRAATVQQFASAPSSLVDSRAFSGVDVGIGLSKTIMLESTGRATLAYFYGIADSLSGAKTLAQSIQGTGSPGSWVDQTSNQWKAWLSSGMGTSLKAPVPQWTQAFQIALVTNRHSQQPEYGSFLAATNPSYHYKVWVRDAAVTALAFDATGYLNEAEKYWIWMAQVQADASTASPQVPVGTWWTNYSYFARNVHIHFVEPELDSIGLFLIGIYRHHAALKARDPGRAAAFLEIVWPAAQKAADYVNNEVRRLDLALALSSGSQPTPSSPHFNFGFGPKDSSIWEEEEQYNAFTQTTYASGLHAAQLLALERGQASSAQAWAQASDTIREAIFRDTSIDPCPGNWHALKNYFIRAVQPDCTLDQRVDSSSGLLWIFGLLEAKSPRTALHRRAILLNLARGDFGYGISRYEGDGYYHTFGAGGPNEALDFMPVWPQVSMYMAMLEHWLGMDDLAANRLSWYVATTLEGYATPGEAVDWVTERPLVSTASEPVTGAWYVLALLNQLGMFDSRLP
jgi:GH15 family glucan-1,4-alpha-glucosidase